MTLLNQAPELTCQSAATNVSSNQVSESAGTDLVSLHQPSEGLRQSLFQYVAGMGFNPMELLGPHCFVSLSSLADELQKHIKPPEKNIPGLKFSMRPDILAGWTVNSDCFLEWGETRRDKFGRDWCENVNFDTEFYLPWLELPNGSSVMLCHHWHELLDFAIEDEFFRPVILVLKDQES